MSRWARSGCADGELRSSIGQTTSDRPTGPRPRLGRAAGGLPCDPVIVTPAPLSRVPFPIRGRAGRSRDDVEPAQYVPSSEAIPSRDPPPEADPVESEAPFSLAEAIAYGLRDNPAAPTGISPGRGGSRRRGNRLRTLLARVRARFGFSGFDTGRITPQEKTIVTTLLFIASCPSCRTITLAPKKLIRTRRASEGSASEPSLARRVSMC